MPRWTRTVVIGSAFALAATVAPPTATADVEWLPVPRIQWTQCPDDAWLRCAMVPAPLDYADPHGKKINLRLVKRPADHPNRKIGTLFVNNGGPGGSAADFAGRIKDQLGRQTSERFDIVGIDPRGIAGQRNCLTKECGSEPVVCAAAPADPPGPPAPAFAFPNRPGEVREQLAYDDFYRGLCAKRGNEILHHMSTADTARDMDLIRRAVGDWQLNYYGLSYGTILGATYAALFPNRIRTMIVDGVLDPVAWSTGRGADSQYTVAARLGSGYGAWETLTSAFAECDRVGPTTCPAAGKAAAKYYAIIERLKQGDVDTPDGKINYQDVVAYLLQAMYDPRDYPQIMQAVEATYQQIFGTPGNTARATWPAVAGSRRPTYGTEIVTPTFHAVMCADSANPTDRDAAARSAAHSDTQGPGFGALWAWSSSACVNWPGSSASAYRGPWNTRTSSPVLIVGNVHDPATPISGARAMNALMPKSTLLTVTAWGHGTWGISQCVKDTFVAYLVDHKSPPAGAVCAPDAPLFPAPN